MRTYVREMWMVLSSEHRTIKLPDGRDFFGDGLVVLR